MTLQEFLSVYTVNDGSGGRKLKVTVSGGVDDPQNYLTLSDPLGGRMIKVDLAGGVGIQSIVAGRNITVDNTDPDNPVVATTAQDITVVANYSALPAPGTVSENPFYWVSNSQGTQWLPGSLGGTYYPKGLYYSNGVSWEYIETPYQATQAEVNTGTNDDKFVTPLTFTNATRWTTVEPVITPGTVAQYWRGDKTWQTLDTLAVPENTNLYFTNTRVNTQLNTYTGDVTFLNGVSTISNQVPKVLATVTGIDGTVAANTLIHTVTTSKTCIVTGVTVRLTSISGAGNGPKLSLGTNAATYNNIMANTDLKVYSSTTDVFRFSVEGIYHAGQSTETIRIIVNTASTYTTYVMSVDLMGYEI